jgi:hypothetical protein
MNDTNQITVDQRILELVTTACKHPPGHPVRQKNFTQAIRLLSKKLWKENTPYYQDALQQTWLHFCKNVCTAYDPNHEKHASIATWLNKYLKFRLKDGYLGQRQELSTRAQPRLDEDGKPIDPFDAIPGCDGYVEPLWEKVRAWAEEDATGELSRLHIEGQPRVTCQVLILRRLLSESSWKELSQEFGIAIPTLSSFYRRQCMPRLRDFGGLEG